MLIIIRSIILLSFFTFSINMLIADAKNKELMCNDWLTGNEAGIQPAFQSEPASSDNILRDTSTDEAGVKGQCRDFYPTWGERMKLERLNTDPFETQYQITREYCWARWAFDNYHRCGGPKVTRWCLFIPCGFSWSPPNYTCWGDTKIKIVDSNFKSNDEFKLFGSFNIVVLKRIKPHEMFPGNLKNTSKRTKVCAYFKTNFVGSLFTSSKNLIGCVDEPFKLVPPTFNVIIPPTAEPYVNQKLNIKTLLANGSKFDQPIAVLEFDDPDTLISSQLFLRYRFPGDNSTYNSVNVANADAPVCDKFKNYPITYCAKVPTSNPSQVCVCEQANCDNEIFIGCLPRPTPKDSNIAIMGSYTTVTNRLGNQQPAINLFLAYTDKNQNPIIIDSDGDEVYQKRADSKKYYKKDKIGYSTDNLAKEPLQYKKLPLPSTPVIIKEYTKELIQNENTGTQSYAVTRGSGSAYGITFNAIIPEMDTLGKPKKINVRTPQMRWNIDGCVVATQEAPGEYPSHYVPTGKRFRDNCCHISTTDVNVQMQKCILPPYQPRCFGSENSSPPWKDKGLPAPMRDKLAENAVCPGSYEGPLINIDGSLKDPLHPDQICITNESDWEDAMPEPYCQKMPLPCQEVKIPTEQSGYAVWLKTDPNSNIDSGTKQNGKCDIAFGFDYRRDIIVTLNDDVIALPDDNTDKINALIELSKAKSDLTKLKAKAAAENRNIQLAEFRMADNMVIAPNSSSITKNGVTITRTAPIIPTRQCVANIYSTNVINPCVKADTCVAITSSAPVNGNLILPDSAHNYKSAANSNAAVANSSSINNPLTDFSQIVGTCVAPYKQQIDSTGKVLTPIRKCITDYYTAGNKIFVLKQVWEDDVQNRCEKPDDK